MNIGILGSGPVGRAIGSRLVRLGHQVRMGSRSSGNAQAMAWVEHHGPSASAGTFGEAAAFGGSLLFNCTAGAASLQALGVAGQERLAGKILIDVSNPVDPSEASASVLSVCNTDSLGEQIQRAFPSTRVVKALNTVSCALQVDPAALPGEHSVFICGNDAEACRQVASLLETFGWRRSQIIQLGDISAARGTEMMLPLRAALSRALHTSSFNLQLLRPADH